jgi:hypothetical protein
MRLRQYVYFGIYSDTLTAADITGKLGVEPDAVRVLGSRSAERAIARHHLWRVESEDLGLTVTDHLDIIVDRLNPCAGEIGCLVEEIVLASPESIGVGSVLEVVRHFDDDGGEEERPSLVDQPDGGRLERLPGQHQLLGWRLTPNVIDFLHVTHAVFDVDEYG